uniref:RNA-binding protein 40 n=4 Tax=Schistocephalus solidus TaxID=70667 RepID=A0A0X3PUE3_SCHSO
MKFCEQAFRNDCVLFFKNLPSVLEDSDIISFLKRLGAKSTELLPSTGRLGTRRAFAEFSSSNDCWKIVKSLHQFNLLGTRISVEFARVRSCFSEVEASPQNANSSHPISSDFSQNEWINQLLSISPRWLPMHAWKDSFYSYPKASTDILTNIVRCMQAVPSFYIQVVHLMNRFNFPPPFCEPAEFPGSLRVVDEKNLPRSLENHAQFSVSTDQGLTEDPEEMEVSSGPESELESDDEQKRASSATNSGPSGPLQHRPRMKLPKGLIVRREKRLDIKGRELRPLARELQSAQSDPTEVATPTSPVAIFRDTNQPFRGPVRIAINVSGLTPAATADLENSVKSRTSNSPTTPAGFGVFSFQSSTEEQSHYLEPSKLPDQTQSTCDEALNGVDSRRAPPKPPASTQQETPLYSTHEYWDAEFLSIAQLEAGRVSVDELSENPVFAKSSSEPGIPSSRLYIKNLAKSVSEKDLWRLFGSFRSTGALEDGISSRFSIRLLTGGRMKGQAFVSFDSVELATAAMHAVHGYRLHDRPVFVQYARVAPAKPDPKSLLVSAE